MRILKLKGNYMNPVKWLIYIIVSYLLASWGVNGVVNPVHYVRAASMQVTELEAEETADGVSIALPETGLEGGVLVFEITASKDYKFKLKVVGVPEAGEHETMTIEACRGTNSVNLIDNSWVSVLIPVDSVKQQEIDIDDVRLSEYRSVSLGRMLYIFAVFLLMLTFWEAVQWVKKRYAE